MSTGSDPEPDTVVLARPLYEALISKLASLLGRPVSAGRFGAMMQVASVNDGPVTLSVET